MGNLRRKTIGIKTFGNKVDITDPCYKKDVWCRLNDIEITPGDYTCIAWKSTETYEYNGKEHKDVRVGNLGIYLNGVIPSQKSMEEIGEIGVDAGLAGIFNSKPDLDDDSWRGFCDYIDKGDHWIFNGKDSFGLDGVCSSSGYGDGMYGVYAAKKDGKISAIEIRFM